MATLFLTATSIVILGWLWFYVVRPILEDYGVIKVSIDSETDSAVMSPLQGADRQTDQTDEDRRALSVADQWLDRLEVDRTRAAVVDLLVYSGWSVSDIRKANILRGDNALIGPEVEAARLRLGIAPEPPREILVNHERRIPLDVEQPA